MPILSTHRARCVSLAAGLAITLATAAAFGQDSSAMADSLFRQAVSLAKAGRYAQAADKFQASYRLDPARGTLLGLAMAEERSGRLAQAQEHYEALLDAAKQAHDTRRERLAQKRLAVLQPRVPHLVIGSTPAGTHVTVDGTELPGAALNAPLPVDPGRHVVHAQTPDGRTFDKTIHVSEGQKVDVTPIFSAAPQSKAKPVPTNSEAAQHAAPVAPAIDTHRVKESSSALRTVGIVVGGAGVAAAGVGAYFWFKSGATYNDLASRCPSACSAADRQAIDSGRSQENLGRVLLIGGAVGIAAGAAMFIIGAPHAEKGTVAIAPAIGPGQVALEGRF